MRLHVIVDHSTVVAIFNDRTSLTVLALPPSASHDSAAAFGREVNATAWRLRTANPNDDVAGDGGGASGQADGVGAGGVPAWQVPKIHNAPVCNRYPTPRL